MIREGMTTDGISVPGGPVNAENVMIGVVTVTLSVKASRSLESIITSSSRSQNGAAPRVIEVVC